MVHDRDLKENTEDIDEWALEYLSKVVNILVPWNVIQSP